MKSNGQLQSEFGVVRGKGSKNARGMGIDLGLAVLSLVRIQGVELSSNDIAAFCGCSASYIREIESNALKKLRHPSKKWILKYLFATYQ